MRLLESLQQQANYKATCASSLPETASSSAHVVDMVPLVL